MAEWMTVEIVPLPEHFLQHTKSVGRPRNPDPLCDFSLTDVADMLKVIPSDDYDLWRAVGIILGRTFDRSDEAWQLYHEWSDTWGGKKATYANPALKTWLDVMSEKGWTARPGPRNTVAGDWRTTRPRYSPRK